MLVDDAIHLHLANWDSVSLQVEIIFNLLTFSNSMRYRHITHCMTLAMSNLVHSI